MAFLISQSGLLFIVTQYHVYLQCVSQLTTLVFVLMAFLISRSGFLFIVTQYHVYLKCISQLTTLVFVSMAFLISQSSLLFIVTQYHGNKYGGMRSKLQPFTNFWNLLLLWLLCSVDAKNSAEAKSTVGRFDSSRARSEGATCIILWYHVWKSTCTMEQNRGENSPARLREKKCQVWCSLLQVVAWSLWAGRLSL